VRKRAGGGIVNAAENGPVVHGDEQTPPTRTGDAREAQRGAERAALVKLIREPHGHVHNTPTTAYAEAVADAVLAAGYVRVQDDDETVDRVAKALHAETYVGLTSELLPEHDVVWQADPALRRPWQRAARAALAEVRGSVSGGGNATT
jgi:hypothetical protein